MADGQVFDAEYYAKTYPDVVQALGTDADTLYKHYLTYGKKEGRNPYSPEVKAAQDALTAQKILAFQSRYPEGMKWTNENSYQNQTAAPHVTFYGCAAFAMQVSDAVYGIAAPIDTFKPKTCAELQSGDIVRIFHDTHSVVVISIDDKYVTVCEGNYNGKVHWNGKYPRAMLDGDMTYAKRRVIGQQIITPSTGVSKAVPNAASKK